MSRLVFFDSDGNEVFDDGDTRVTIPQITTNADRIRAMSDEELAEWIERIRVLCAIDACGQACPLKDVCYSMAEEPTETLDWLRQEVKE